MTHPANDMVEMAALNAVSWTVVFSSFHWQSLLPDAAHAVQWIMGLLVAASIITLNLRKLYLSFKSKKHVDAD